MDRHFITLVKQEAEAVASLVPHGSSAAALWKKRDGRGGACWAKQQQQEEEEKRHCIRRKSSSSGVGSDAHADPDWMVVYPRPSSDDPARFKDTPEHTAASDQNPTIFNPTRASAYASRHDYLDSWLHPSIGYPFRALRFADKLATNLSASSPLLSSISSRFFEMKETSNFSFSLFLFCLCFETLVWKIVWRIVSIDRRDGKDNRWFRFFLSVWFSFSQKESAVKWRNRR